jgi:flagellin
MTRINTNISSLTAQQNLAMSNNQLQTTLTRLSTGLQINSGADNPSGLIAATDLGNDIATSQQAISNSQVANQMISTADSALSQISTLLTSMQSLINQAANTATMSPSEIAANQLQIDSSLDAINRISQTTSFQGQNLLDGSLGFDVAQGSGFGSVQNLQINQANFGTASSVPVDINIVALATQATLGATINDGSSSDAKATSTTTFNDGSSVSVTAPATGTTSNSIRIAYNTSSSIAAGSATAAFDSTTQTLNVTVANTGVTSATTIANAINSGTDFTATASTSLATKGFNAANDTTTLASTTISTGDAGSLKITSLVPGAVTPTVTFTEGNASSGPVVSVDSSGNLNVLVNGSNYNGGVTSLASIAKAINAYMNSNGQQVFSAGVLQSGNVNTAVNAATGVAVDGPATATVANSVTTVTLDGTDSFTLTGIGAEANGARVVVQQGNTSGIQWDSNGNGGTGQLTITLSATGGSGGGGGVGSYTAADLTALFGAAGAGVTVAAGSTANPFTAADFTGIAAGGYDSTQIGTGGDVIQAVGNTTAGVEGVSNALDGALAGGGDIGGLFSGGTGTSGLAANLTLEVGGDNGSQLLSFDTGTTALEIASAINQISDSTGVGASTIGDQLKFNSTDYGSAANVSVKVVNEATGGKFGSSLTANNASGTDISATVNNVAATGAGNTVSLNAPTLSFSAALNPADLAVGDNINFTITGGGALFQLGPNVESSEQARLGIQSVDTGSLGGTMGDLYELGSGNTAALSADPALASQIASAAADQVSELRGRLGAFQASTVDTNINALTDAVTNLTAAQSTIQDTDFAAESANLTREQILVQAGTSVLSIANKNPENVLTLLQNS